ncbi:MAG: bifunctional nuclease family protein [Treponema sp.]|jgi:bifunctional DNase/RNase|nr:bifunctional nuclease family protein [Treponema sp.]
MEMLEAEIWTMAQTDQGSAVLLRPLKLDMAVPIFIGQLEAQSILIGCEKAKVKRPLTHDLFLSLLRHTGLSLSRAEVHALQGDTFYARLVILGEHFFEKKSLILDARPSDALALAVRRGCPIFVSSRVVEQAGIPVDIIMERLDESSPVFGTGGPEPPHPSRSDKRWELLEQLNKAVAAEEYERAAEIRDMLNLLDKDAKD